MITACGYDFKLLKKYLINSVYYKTYLVINYIDIGIKTSDFTVYANHLNCF